MNKEIKDIYKELDDILYDMSVSVELFRILENDIWHNPTVELKDETKGVLSLAIDNYEDIFNRLETFFHTKIEEKIKALKSQD